MTGVAKKLKEPLDMHNLNMNIVYCTLLMLRSIQTIDVYNIPMF